MRKIEISGKEYEIGVNALTMFLYKKEFKTGMMADIGRLQNLYIKQPKIDTEGKSDEDIALEVGNAMLPNLDDYIEVSLRVAYILIKTANRNFMPFEDWVQTITEFDINDSWISEVTELAVNSFCGSGIGGTTQTSKD